MHYKESDSSVVGLFVYAKQHVSQPVLAAISGRGYSHIEYYWLLLNRVQTATAKIKLSANPFPCYEKISSITHFIPVMTIPFIVVFRLSLQHMFASLGSRIGCWNKACRCKQLTLNNTWENANVLTLFSLVPLTKKLRLSAMTSDLKICHTTMWASGIMSRDRPMEKVFWREYISRVPPVRMLPLDVTWNEILQQISL